MKVPYLDHRPIIVAVAGPNGSGKTTFYRAFLQSAGLRFINADVLGREFGVGADQAADLAKAIRCELVNQRESFVFETVFSDPVGDNRRFLGDAAHAGYTVVLCFIGVSSADVSEERVAMRVTQGGHDVPTEELASRFPRTMANLMAAVQELPCVLVFDNNDLAAPFRPVATFLNGKPVDVHKPIPAWLRPALPGYPR
jgi:predicted ABC-type ATPase